MVVSQNIDQNYYRPYYGTPQKGTPNFGKPPYWDIQGLGLRIRVHNNWILVGLVLVHVVQALREHIINIYVLGLDRAQWRIPV